jgi:hypothetical protein
VIEDLVDDGGLDDESENFHAGCAAGTIEGVDLVDPVEELGPSTAPVEPGSAFYGPGSDEAACLCPSLVEMRKIFYPWAVSVRAQEFLS